MCTINTAAEVTAGWRGGGPERWDEAPASAPPASPPRTHVSAVPRGERIAAHVATAGAAVSTHFSCPQVASEALCC